MPEYLAPGVYVEEVSFRPKSIEGVSTSTTAFVGPTRKGPLTETPEVVTSFGEFSRIYGGLANLSFESANDANPNVINYMAYAVRAYFDNGGSRLYVARTFMARQGSDGRASSGLVAGEDTDPAAQQARFRARMPGSGGNGSIVALEKATPAALATMNAAPNGSLLTTDADDTYVKRDAGWLLDDDPNSALDLNNALPAGAALVSLNVEVIDRDGNSILYEDLGFDAEHPRHIGAVLTENPARRADALQNPYYLDAGEDVTAFTLQTGLAAAQAGGQVIALSGGNDGIEPTNTATANDDVGFADGLAMLEDIEDISIVAAPGHSAYGSYRDVQNSLLSHAERMRYRIAVLDTEDGLLPGGARDARSQIDSKYGALYYPWVTVSNVLARPGNEQIPREITLPPSGFIAGIYARNDNQRGVWKAPANEVVRGALRFASEINHRQQETLNPEGVNVLRYFPGRGYLVWGARTVSSDPEWKYVNVRRYFIYLEHSIDRSTQWAVFEPNGPALWSNIRETVSAFLYNEWVNGALLGNKPEEAYFVRCDRSTMTQNDLDNGRLICEIGVAVLYPAEFVIFRIGQKTADARS